MFLKYFTIFAIIGFSVCKNVEKPRIVGGDDAEIEDFPYQVAIIYIDTQFCGGSILTPNYIVSAAHCFYGLDRENFYIRAGSTLNNQGGKISIFDKITIHSQYDSTTQDYDIAIAKLSQSLSFSSTIQPVKLPETGASFENQNGIATGWGRLSSNGAMSITLQKVELPILQDDVCSLVYGDRFTARMTCAGYPQGGKDTCQGDSGGPLVVNGVLVGVTSWGDGCAQSNSPGVYAKVSNFIDFINSIINA